MPFSTAYPPSSPTITGDTLSISLYLNQPARVTRLLNELTLQRYIAERIFGAGPTATGGAVVYDQATESDLFLQRDVEPVAPLSEFPILTDTAPTPKTASVTKWGGRILISDEARDRNNVAIFVREMTKLRNTVVRKVDTVAIAALDAAPVNTMVGTDWTAATAAQIIANLVDAIGLINNPDNGYVASALFLNPVQADELLKNTDLVKMLQAEPPGRPVRDATVGRLLGLDIFKSNRVTAGTARVVADGVGAISDETPMAVETYREPGIQGTYIQASRRLVPYVTDPKAATSLTGI